MHIVNETLFEEKHYYEPFLGMSFTVDVDDGKTKYIYECILEKVNTYKFTGNKCGTVNPYNWTLIEEGLI